MNVLAARNLEAVDLLALVRPITTRRPPSL